MPIETCGLNLSLDRRELKPHGTPDFPCAAYYGTYKNGVEDAIPWHYHEELELCYISKGQLTLQIPGRRLHAKKGDSIFLNSNVLHFAKTDSECELYSLVFHPLFISGCKDSLIDQTYITPLTHCNALPGLCFDHRILSHQKISLEIATAYDALSLDLPGFEFLVRDSLSRVCYFICQEYHSKLVIKQTELDQDQFRIRTMLQFIHLHYAEPLTISLIAASAKIGERESLRCFQRMIQSSPLQYLLKYRITKGASMLLSQKSASIAEISSHCGFNSPSNFAQTFKKYYNLSPKEYRQQKN